jgi:phosphoribosylanthranilate isomerase
MPGAPANDYPIGQAKVSVTMKVKICGITSLSDAEAAIAAGADLLGFILYPKSPRYIAPAQLGPLLAQLPPEIITVGVFVSEPALQVQQILATTGLQLAQLHGNESVDDLLLLSGRAFKALRPADEDQAVAEAQSFAPLGLTPGPSLLIDAYDPLAYGGTGKRADWNIAATLALRYAGLMLAGGLTPANVAAAVARVQPWAVDVSSGVESQPGSKDHGAVRAFITAAKAQARPTP